MTESNLIKKKPKGKMLLFGVFSVGLYLALFLNSETVMRFFTKGGMYAVLPIGTVFLFSYVHGAFAGNFWSVLGIDAKKTQLQEKMEQKKSTVRRSEQSRPRIRVQA
ncbi:MAG: hypothetical protein A2V65_09295 [Deltaproteobacteria bacterium RBG_13_49_15]|nr:MAG: hypothetical protein A2V65_09295 [Deltaproteobacteria bacterium RBG_13_49_15]